MGVVDSAAADEAIAAAAVPRFQELLVRVRPGAWKEQLEFHRPQAARAAALLGEVDEGASDSGAALFGGRDQHAELARVGRDVVDPDAADDLAVAGGDRDLFRPDQLGEFGRFRPSHSVAPDPAFGDRVHIVDELGELIDELGVGGGSRIELANVDHRPLLLLSPHGLRFTAAIQQRKS